MFLCCCSEDSHDKSAITFDRPARVLESPVLLTQEAKAAVAPSVESGPSMNNWALREATDEPLRPPEEDEPHTPSPVAARKEIARAKPAVTEAKTAKPAAEKASKSKPVAEGPKATPASAGSARITYFVSFNRTASSVFGIDLSAAGKFCVVNGVSAGTSLVGQWNASVEEDRRVNTQDRLLGINGCTSEKGKDLLERLKGANGELALEFQRPTLFEVGLTPDPKIGVGLGLKAGPSFLMVTSIDGAGAAKEYNARAMPQQDIKISSRILAVNGKEGKGDELLSSLKAASGLVKLSMAFWN